MNIQLEAPPEIPQVSTELPVVALEQGRMAKSRRWLRQLPRRILRGILSAMDWFFGTASLMIGLAFLSVIPVLNFLSLGYLLHLSGRVAATGRLRDGFVGVRKASVLGNLIFGTWLMLWPVRFVSGMWQDAHLIAPGGSPARNWRLVLVLTTVITLWHIAWACLRGGRLRHFLWPAPLRFWRWLRNPDKQPEKFLNAMVDYSLSLRLPYYFSVGFRGFVGALTWLLVPVGVLLLASRLPNAPLAALLSLAGGFLLLLTVLYLPFLQTHFARTGRFESLFALREIRGLFCRAPLAFWFASLVVLLFALPLYLLKIELPPRELAWLPSLVFVAFIFPARLLTGWAMSRALRREQPRHAVFRWLSRLAVLPVAGVYVLFVYLTQYLSWNGAMSLLEQHAFLVPAPLMGL